MDVVAPTGSESGGCWTHTARTARGVTLIELMVVVAILAIVIGLAAPYLGNFFVSNRLDSSFNTALSALSLARAEAIRRGQPVTIASLSGGQNWSTGWTVCVDPGTSTNGNPFVPTGTCPSSAPVIARGNALNSALTLYSDATLAGYVTFDSGGRSVRTNGTFVGGTFVICHGTQLVSGSTAMSRAIAISSAGRIRRAFDTGSDKIPNKDSGANVASCTSP